MLYCICQGWLVELCSPFSVFLSSDHRYIKCNILLVTIIRSPACVWLEVCRCLKGGLTLGMWWVGVGHWNGWSGRAGAGTHWPWAWSPNTPYYTNDWPFLQSAFKNNDLTIGKPQAMRQGYAVRSAVWRWRLSGCSRGSECLQSIGMKFCQSQCLASYHCPFLFSRFNSKLLLHIRLQKGCINSCCNQILKLCLAVTDAQFWIWIPGPWLYTSSTPLPFPSLPLPFCHYWLCSTTLLADNRNDTYIGWLMGQVWLHCDRGQLFGMKMGDLQAGFVFSASYN